MTKMFDLEHCGQCGEETDELYCSFLCEECEKKDRANAALGKAVRTLPDGYVLHHVGGEWAAYRIQTGPWQHNPKQCPSINYVNTPEEAIAAALEVENENV